MTTIRTNDVTTPTTRLHLAFELGWSEWKLAFTIGHGQAPRLRTIAARDLEALTRELAKAKERFHLPADAPVVSCFEAGRDGFWLHRYLSANGVNNLVVDSASIEVNRRQRRAKTDRLDAGKLVTMLLRYHAGECKVWSVVRVPSVADEDHRQLHREMQELKAERTQHVNRIKGLLASHGIAAPPVNAKFLEALPTLRQWDGSGLAEDSQRRLVREYERWQFVDRQIKDLENDRCRRIRRDETPHVAKVRQLLQLAGVGLNGAWLLVFEVFGWRKISNRKQVGALAGMTPTPSQSGDGFREQGISKAGNRRLRTMMVELAWCWLRYQPASELSQWYARRFMLGGTRARKVGIVALARKLSVAFWRYLEQGEVPKGAKLVEWGPKAHKTSRAAA
jgi:transposase